MMVVLTVVAGSDHGVGVEVDAADEGDCGVLTRVHEPGLLVLAESGGRPVPADQDA
jgi:hypothetical protein